MKTMYVCKRCQAVAFDEVGSVPVTCNCQAGHYRTFDGEFRHVDEQKESEEV